MIKCIAIDDEPLALRQIAGYIDKTPFLELKGKFESALHAMSWLNENTVDLMFVDISMPDLSGMEFVKSLQDPPKIIFTTAYSEYAVEGFRVDAVDYLLKPISYSDFLNSAQKALERLAKKTDTIENVESNASFLFIRSDYKILRINLMDIKYVESQREYVQIFIENQKPVMTLLSMKKLINHLPDKDFMRVHRSFIVNLNKITVVERSRIVFGDVYIPVSEQYKETFQKFVEGNFL